MVADDTEPAAVVAVALDVGAVKAGVPGGADIVRPVADEHAVARLGAGLAERHVDEPGVGLPADLLGTADDGVEPVADVDRIQHRVHEVLLAVGHQHRRVGQFADDGGVITGDADPDGAVDLGSWTREWGLVVPDGNPGDVAGIADLVDRELRFVNRTTDSGLRTTLGTAVAALADDRGAERHDLVEAVDGFEFAVRAHESPARKVLAGAADAGLGLRSTAEQLGMGFVPCGEERVRAFAAEERREKPGVRRLERAIKDADDVLGSLPGYGR